MIILKIYNKNFDEKDDFGYFFPYLLNLSFVIFLNNGPKFLGGRICETGSYNELVTNGGAFAEFIEECKENESVKEDQKKLQTSTIAYIDNREEVDEFLNGSKYFLRNSLNKQTDLN